MTLHDTLEHLGNGTRFTLDFISATVAVGVIAQLLPPLAAAMTVVWTGLQIFGWFESRAQKAKEADENKP